MQYHIYRIGFNGNDETEFDVEAGAPKVEIAELMELFLEFLCENPDIEFKGIDYIEKVGEYNENNTL